MRPTTSRRRARSRIRRPRFVSLRRQLSLPPPPPPPPPLPAAAPAMSSSSSPDGVVPGDGHDEPHVASLLGDVDSIGGGPTLAALLGGISDASSGLSPAPSPVAGWEGGGGDGDGDGDRLARRALRGRERWVYYCHASAAGASASSTEEEVASSAAGVADPWWGVPQALSLKLDYEVILSAWSDRGSLYIDGDGPQVVPELHRTVSPVMVEVGSTGAWLVPEAREDPDRTVEKDGGSREARVMRYKEKRRSRLFAKKIRYEVRKLNAEKRPRIKGRFVKREDNV